MPTYKLQNLRSFHTTSKNPLSCADDCWDLDGFPTADERASAKYVWTREIDGSLVAVFATGDRFFAQLTHMCRA